MSTAIKHPVADRVKLSHERQSARMSKITNDGLTRSGTVYFTAVGYPYGNSGLKKKCDRNGRRDMRPLPVN